MTSNREEVGAAVMVYTCNT